MFEKKKFTLTENHLKLMRRMYVEYENYCEFGAPEIDPKRPYGNSNVYYDIGDILGIKPSYGSPEDPEFSEDQEQEMLRLHKETSTALQIVLATGCFEEGCYEASSYSRMWVKV